MTRVVFLCPGPCFYWLWNLCVRRAIDINIGSGRSRYQKIIELSFVNPYLQYYTKRIVRASDIQNESMSFLEKYMLTSIGKSFKFYYCNRVNTRHMQPTSVLPKQLLVYHEF